MNHDLLSNDLNQFRIDSNQFMSVGILKAKSLIEHGVSPHILLNIKNINIDYQIFMIWWKMPVNDVIIDRLIIDFVKISLRRV